MAKQLIVVCGECKSSWTADSPDWTEKDGEKLHVRCPSGKVGMGAAYPVDLVRGTAQKCDPVSATVWPHADLLLLSRRMKEIIAIAGLPPAVISMANWLERHGWAEERRDLSGQSLAGRLSSLELAALADACWCMAGMVRQNHRAAKLKNREEFFTERVSAFVREPQPGVVSARPSFGLSEVVFRAEQWVGSPEAFSMATATVSGAHKATRRQELESILGGPKAAESFILAVLKSQRGST
jgi:hypothetical protein